MIEQVKRTDRCQCHPRREVVPAVGKHSREEIFSQQRDAAKENSEDGNEQDAANPLIAVRRAEDDSGDDDCDGDTMQERDILRLKITAKNQFFRKADDQAKESPCSDLNTVRGREFHELLGEFDLLLP